MKKLFNQFLSIFYPDLCVVCRDRLVDSEDYVCTDCLLSLPKTNFHIQSDNGLEQFFAGRIPFRRAAAFAYFVKGGSLQQIIHELKYNRNPNIGYFIGKLCGDHLLNSEFLNSIDVLVPVPLHPKRLKERGYNQSLTICEGISFVTGIPIDSKTLVRTINNPSQTKNSRLNRWLNVEDVFLLTDKDAFGNKHILLIDDVITTGSTIESCGKEIMKSENVCISIFAVGMAT